jgi:hypothetical protein
VRRLAAALAVFGILAAGCVKEETSPPPPGDLDSIESTLNGVESELDEP